MDWLYVFSETVPNTIMAIAAAGAAVVFIWRRNDKREAKQLRDDDRAEVARLRQQDRDEQARIRQADLDAHQAQRLEDLAAIRDARRERIAERMMIRPVILREGAPGTESGTWGMEVQNLNYFSVQDLCVEFLWNGKDGKLTFPEIPPGQHFFGSDMELKVISAKFTQMIRESDIQDVVTSRGYRVERIAFSHGAERFQRDTDGLHASKL